MKLNPGSCVCGHEKNLTRTLFSDEAISANCFVPYFYIDRVLFLCFFFARVMHTSSALDDLWALAKGSLCIIQNYNERVFRLSPYYLVLLSIVRIMVEALRSGQWVAAAQTGKARKCWAAVQRRSHEKETQTQLTPC
jgi:hypothetical protein